jgi:1-acyl-sn-glycerol-3-phosphate acyltransferase
MLRALLCWLIFAVMTVILGTVAIFLSLFDSSGNIPHLVARLWGKIQLWIAGIRVSITGLQNINPQKSYILVSNHQSNFDIFALLGYLPIQFRWIAKAELFRVPFMGWAMHRIGYISIERDSPKKAYRSMLQAAEAVNRGVSVMPLNPRLPSCRSPSRVRPRSCGRETGGFIRVKSRLTSIRPLRPPESPRKRKKSCLSEYAARWKKI